MSRSYLRTSAAPAGLPLLVLLAIGLFSIGSAAGKGKPDPQAAAAEEESNDPCLLDGLCRAHYLRARNLSRDGNFDGALAAYEAAFRRRSVPWLLISIGRTLHKLGRPAEAIQQYQRYRQEDKNPNPTRLSRVDEYTKQAEADVAAAAKRAPAPTPPPPSDNGGDANTGKTGAGSNTGPAPSGDSGTTVTKLPPPPPSSTTSPPAIDAASAAAAPGGTAPGAPTPQPRWKWPGLWIGLGVSGGMLLLGSALGIAAQASSSQLRGMTYVGVSPTSDVVALQDRIRGLAISADVFFAATAVSVGVTLALTFARKPAVERPVSRPLPGLEDLDTPPVASPRGAPVPPAASGSSPSAPAKAEPAATPSRAPAASPELAAPAPSAPSAPSVPSVPSAPSAPSSSGPSPAPGLESAPAEAPAATAAPVPPAAVPASPSPAAPAPSANSPSASSPAAGGGFAGESKPSTPASPQTGKSAP